MSRRYLWRQGGSIQEVAKKPFTNSWSHGGLVESIWSIILFSHMPAPAPKLAAREERRAYGQSLRQKVSRASQADWDPSRRKVSILELLRVSERGRVANLLPIKAARMAASPFGFTGARFRLWLAISQGSQAPAFIRSYVATRTFTIWELLRGRMDGSSSTSTTLTRPFAGLGNGMSSAWLASLVLAGRESNNTEKECKIAALAFVEGYRQAMQRFSEMPTVTWPGIRSFATYAYRPC